MHDPLQRIVRSELGPMNVRELIVSERLPDVFLDQLCRFWEFLTAEFLDDCDDDC